MLFLALGLFRQQRSARGIHAATAKAIPDAVRQSVKLRRLAPQLAALAASATRGLERFSHRGWRKGDKRVAKGWRKGGERVAKGWRKVGAAVQ